MITKKDIIKWRGSSQSTINYSPIADEIKNILLLFLSKMFAADRTRDTKFMTEALAELIDSLDNLEKTLRGEKWQPTTNGKFRIRTKRWKSWE